MAIKKGGTGLFANVLEEITDSLSESFICSSNVLSDIAVQLVKYRIDNELDQKQLAELLNVSQPMISKYESGHYNFTIKTLFDIAYKIGLDVDVKIGTKAESRNDDNYFSTIENKASWETSEYLKQYFETQKKDLMPKSVITEVA